MFKKVLICLGLFYSVEATELDNKSLKNYIIYQSLLSGVDPILALSVVSVESSFKSNVARYEPRLGTCSVGLFQVLHTTALGLGFSGNMNALMNVQENVFYGLKYLKLCSNKYSHIKRIACCYNAGLYASEIVCNSLNVQNYSKKIIKAYNHYYIF